MTAALTRRPVIIAGGGIGGLVAALALARRGFDVELLEERSGPSETGAGIQIGPNAVKALESVGLRSKVEPLAGRPREIEVRSAATNRVLARLPLNPRSEERFGAPYLTFSRPDLHYALRQAVASTPAVRMTYGARVNGAEDGEDGQPVKVQLADRRVLDGHALVIADGAWSRLRILIEPEARLVFEKRDAVRTMLPADAVPEHLKGDRTRLWLGPSVHALIYPISAGRQVSFVAIYDSNTRHADWAREADRAEVRQALSSLPAEVAALNEISASWGTWSLHTMRPGVARMARGRIALVGDAAHPIVPFLGQGACLAIEDAVELAAQLAARPQAPADAFKAYAAIRVPRAAQVAAASRQNGEIYRMAGIKSLARNLVMSAMPGEMAMRRYDWLYGYRAGQA